MYAIIMCLYLPWIVGAVRNGWLYKFPIISFCFVGLFTQNALGSIFVMRPELMERYDYFNLQYYAMLCVQILIFYCMTLPYITFAKRFRPQASRVNWPLEMTTMLALCSICVLILLKYMSDVGVPPLLMMFKTGLSGLELIRYRVELTYGLDDYSLYHIGITILPMIIASMALLSYLVRGRKVWLLVVFLAVLIAALPAGKGSILDLVVALCVIYLLYCGGHVDGLRRSIAWKKIGLWIGVSFIPVVAMYQIYNEYIRIWDIGKAILFRLTGVNSESMAAAVFYVRDHGFFDGKTLPSIRGFLDHEQVNLAQEMHHYMFGPGGGAPFSALAEGYVNFGWTGFVSFAVLAFMAVIVAEATFANTPKTLLVLSFIALYSVFAMKIAQLSLFATFISLTYFLVGIAVIVLRFTLLVFVRGVAGIERGQMPRTGHA